MPPAPNFLVLISAEHRKDAMDLPVGFGADLPDHAELRKIGALYNYHTYFDEQKMREGSPL